MNDGRRAYDILRGYVNREWDRLQGIDLAAAERELFESLGVTSAKEAYENQADAPEVVVDEKALARRILGVSESDNFETIRAAFEKLNQRSNPANFPEGSSEAAHAGDIQKRVTWAYSVLSDGVADTEKRFRSLEID